MSTNVYEATRRRPDGHRCGRRRSTKVRVAVRKDRAYAIDATVVRVMKARRTLPQKRLSRRAGGGGRPTGMARRVESAIVLKLPGVFN